MAVDFKQITQQLRLSKENRYPRVLVCGAPERAELIASHLKNAQSIAKHREYHSYLGQFQGKDILVTSHGVGTPGAMVCFQELMDVGAETIIRVGSAGGLYNEMETGDIVVATAAVREDGITALMVPKEYPAVADFGVTQALLQAYQKRKLAVRVGIVLTSDLYYPSLLGSQLELYQRANAIATEMECSALFVAGALRKVKTGCALVLDGNPLKWNEGKYDPTSDRFKKAMEISIKICLEVLALF